jgi:putative glutathione S-transferase
MGQLVDGVWHDGWIDTKSTGGSFVRSTSKFRNWITADGSAGPSGEGGFQGGKRALSPLRVATPAPGRIAR